MLSFNRALVIKFRKFSQIFETLSNGDCTESIDTCVENFVSVIDSVCKPLFEKKCKSSVNTKLKPSQYDDNCEIKRMNFFDKLNKYRNDKTDTNREEMVRARPCFESSVRRFKRDCLKKKTDKLINTRYKDAKEYWKLLKQSQQNKPSKVLSADIFGRYFKAINDPQSPFYQADEDIIQFNERFLNSEAQVMFGELDVEITQIEILKAIKELKTSRSGGPDKLLNEFFINGSNSFLPYLHKLFNVLFNKGYFPQKWSEGYIVPIHKKGNTNDTDNYRGITLLSTLGKLFTSILNNRLITWAEPYYIYIEEQAGFRREMGTVDNIFLLHGLITHLINQGKKLYCAFVDFKKAFDFVNRDIIWYKLIKLGIRGKMLNIIKSMYEDVKSRVKFNNELSEPFDSYLGVRQGECLSPFLFSMYLNDIEEIFYLNGVEGIDIGCIKLFLLLYADDMTIFSETEAGLQQGLNVLETYCNRWKLTVNKDKTKVIVFRKGGILRRDLKFYYQGQELEIVTSFSYLGITFTAGGSFSNAQVTLSGQAQKAIFKLNSYLYHFSDLTPKHVLNLFDKLVTPILNYGSEVWGFCKANQIERVHLQFCKKLLGVKQCTQNNFIYGDLGRVSYQSLRYINIIKYWLKVITKPDNKLVSILYNNMKNDVDADNSTINWVALVRKLLSEMGFYDVWLQQGVGDVDTFLGVFRQRVSDQFQQSWHNEIQNSSRAIFYRTISEFCFQDYLEVVTVKNFRNALSKLRMSSHRLEVETGRWARPNAIPFAERLCKNCNKLEDEFHFVLECPIYSDLRKLYVSRYYSNRPSMYKMVELFNTTNKKQLRNLSIYIFNAFEIRKIVMFVTEIN